MTTSLTLHETITKGGVTACDFLAGQSGLAKARIKDAMVKGAVWLARGRGGGKRLRRATTVLRAGDRIALYYDEAILALVPPPARLVQDLGIFSVWWKPPGLLAQGTRQGDHCTLLRQAEVHFTPRREVYVVHRLDREAAGLMLVAHGREAAARLSALFAGGQVEKRYRAQVVGLFPGDAAREAVIELPLDGKPARTRYTVLEEDAATDTALLDIQIETGRLHQIRRHFAAIGHPLLGDPRYGEGNKDPGGLRLLACLLSFSCPFSGKSRTFVDLTWPWPAVAAPLA